MALLSNTVLLIAAIFWGIGALLLHKIGVSRGWYGGFWWFDHLTHSVSGAGVMLLLIAVFGPALYVWVLFFALVALWETYEYLAGTPRHLWHSFRDMFYDTVFGSAAALLVWVLLV